MEQTFKHPKTFRYVQHGEITSSCTLLYVLHGYGQLPAFFIRKFQHLDPSIVVVAPEGMHRFYLNGTSGRVGASWMTKEDRENDISDNLSFLDALDNKITRVIQPKKRILLGFSQGGATAARWQQLGKIKFDHLILWATVFPPDLDSSKFEIDGNLHFFALGMEDPYFSNEAQLTQLTFYQSKKFETFHFQGDHNIHRETLDLILKKCSSM